MIPISKRAEYHNKLPLAQRLNSHKILTGDRMSLFELIIQEANEPFHISTEYPPSASRDRFTRSHITTTALSNQCHSPSPSPTKKSLKFGKIIQKKIRTDRIIILIYINFQFYRLNTVLIPPPPLFFIVSLACMHSPIFSFLSTVPLFPQSPENLKKPAPSKKTLLVPFTGPIFFVLLPSTPPTFDYNPNPTHILHISVSISVSSEEEEGEKRTDTELI